MGQVDDLFEAFTEKKGTSIKIEDGNYVPGENLLKESKIIT